MKKILAASVTVLAMSQVASAADTIVAPEPEAVEYVRVCDAYGKGYFYIPGTETCLRFAGYVRYDVSGGDNAYARVPSTRDMDTYAQLTRFTFRTLPALKPNSVHSRRSLKCVTSGIMEQTLHRPALCVWALLSLVVCALVLTNRRS